MLSGPSVGGQMPLCSVGLSKGFGWAAKGKRIGEYASVPPPPLAEQFSRRQQVGGATGTTHYCGTPPAVLIRFVTDPFAPIGMPCQWVSFCAFQIAASLPADCHCASAGL